MICAEMSPRPAEHVLNILAGTSDHHPNFTVMLGAGASVASGIKPAAEMIDEWREQYHELYGRGQSKKKFFAHKGWYESPEEYSFLFESLYDQPSQRREYIESCMTKASPSWGYIYLVDLIRQGIFNTVFTTNFDDLINESCYLYSTDVRPIVCAHDSSIESVRLTAKRPKIIKLHGDFLFDSIKNTVRELESLEANIRDKFRQFASEFGMIVVGYRGNDRSIMDTLEALLRSNATFPHGIYWCAREGSLSSLSPAVERLRRFPKFHLIQIDDFDSFMAALHDKLSRVPHPIVQNPYQVVTQKLRRLVHNLRLPEGPTHPVIARDIVRLTAALEQDQSLVRPRGIQPPYYLAASVELKSHKYVEALQLLKKELDSEPSPDTFTLAFQALRHAWDEDYAANALEKLRTLPLAVRRDPTFLVNITVELLHAKKYHYAREVTRLLAEWLPDYEGPDKLCYVGYNDLNYLQTKLHEGDALTPSELATLETIMATAEDDETRLGCLILLGQFERAAAHFREAAFTVSRKEILGWPICQLMPRPTLKKLRDSLEEASAPRPPRVPETRRRRKSVPHEAPNGDVASSPEPIESVEAMNGHGSGEPILGIPNEDTGNSDPEKNLNLQSESDLN